MRRMDSSLSAVAYSRGSVIARMRGGAMFLDAESNPFSDLAVESLVPDASLARLLETTVDAAGKSQASVWTPPAGFWAEGPGSVDLGADWDALERQRLNCAEMRVVAPLDLKAPQHPTPATTLGEDVNHRVFTGKAPCAVNQVLLWDCLKGVEESVDPDKLAALLADKQDATLDASDGTARVPEEACIVVVDASTSMGWPWQEEGRGSGQREQQQGRVLAPPSQAAAAAALSSLRGRPGEWTRIMEIFEAAPDGDYGADAVCYALEDDADDSVAWLARQDDDRLRNLVVYVLLCRVFRSPNPSKVAQNQPASWSSSCTNALK